MTLDWDWAFAASVLPALVSALGVTLVATVGGMVLALTLGLGLALAGGARRRAVSWPAAVLVAFVRNTPLLLQLYFLFYVAPEFGLTLTPLVTGILVLGLHYGTYTAAAYRAGIEAVPRGQWDAAAALGLGRARTVGRVILPQALPPILPVLGNYLVSMLKETPLLASITVLDVMHTARSIGAETFRYVEPLTLVGLLFLAISLCASRLIARLSARVPALAGQGLA